MAYVPYRIDDMHEHILFRCPACSDIVCLYNCAKAHTEAHCKQIRADIEAEKKKQALYKKNIVNAMAACGIAEAFGVETSYHTSFQVGYNPLTDGGDL